VNSILRRKTIQFKTYIKINSAVFEKIYNEEVDYFNQ